MKPDRHIILFACSILLISLFFLLPRNQAWLAERVLPYWNDFLHQKKDMDPEKRKILRYGKAYSYSKEIAGFFKSRLGNALVLLPSYDYFKKSGIDFPVPEPAVFYYYTGLKTVWPNSPEATMANWFVHVQHGKIVIDSVVDLQRFRDTIIAFQKFPPSL